ncbi:hypothetical protein glysoja_007387 [Glycine soja]|nr:hypothetical protein glysoja_007387 [Glycine soja]
MEEEEEEEREEEKKKHKQARPSLFPISVRKGFSGERVKRDEWSEGAVSTLLEAYEAKWVLRNRAKLKGHDWEDVARHVSSPSSRRRQPLAPSGPLANAQNSHGSNGVDEKLAKEDGLGTKSSDQVSSKDPLDTDSSTPALYSQKEELRSNKRKKKTIDHNTGRRRKEYVEIAESLRWLAEAMIRSEQARMDTMKEIERMRVEAEAKRGEMDLKRTEIIANTQLEIARIFASVNSKGVDSSLRIGRS